MFTHNLELKEIFNMSNQRNGDQREALFNAIAAYASNIEKYRRAAAGGRKIAQKHTISASRGDCRSSTTSSGHICWRRWTKCSTREALDACTPCGVLAVTSLFIGKPRFITTGNVPAKDGGWEGTRPFPQISSETPRSALDHQL